MYYSETKVIMGGLAHVPILIFIVNFIKGKFASIALKVVEVKTEEPKSKFRKVMGGMGGHRTVLHRIYDLIHFC